MYMCMSLHIYIHTCVYIFDLVLWMVVRPKGNKIINNMLRTGSTPIPGDYSGSLHYYVTDCYLSFMPVVCIPLDSLQSLQETSYQSQFEWIFKLELWKVLY